MINIVTRRFHSAALLRLDGKTGEGWLRASARLTRTGVFPYRRADGSTRHELRLPEEVFKPEALKSFALVPITNEHPRTDNGLNAENATSFAVGSVAPPHQDGDFVASEVLVWERRSVDDVIAGKSELSCGYYCDLEEKSGVWTDASGKPHRYDVIQRNIHGNHVAIVSKGRAGPEARVRLDADDAIESEPAEHNDAREAHQERHMAKRNIRIDGYDREVEDDVARGIEKERDTNAQMLAAVRKDAEDAKKLAETEKTRADTLAAQLDKMKKDHADATDPAKMSSRIAARVALETRARDVLGKETKLDGMTDAAVQRLVLGKVLPALKLDGKTDDQIAISYETAMAGNPTVNRASEEAQREIDANKNGKGENRNDSRTPEERFNDAVFNRDASKNGTK